MTAAPRAFGPVTSGTTAQRPYLIVAALLLASFVVGFDTRVFAVGLPDLRGAYSLGFDDPAYFTRFFTKHTGLTPTQFRKRNPA